MHDLPIAESDRRRLDHHARRVRVLAEPEEPDDRYFKGRTPSESCWRLLSAFRGNGGAPILPNLQELWLKINTVMLLSCSLVLT